MNINPFDIMKQMGTFQAKLADISATGSAGGGMVEIELNGKLEILSMHITTEAVEGGDTEMLADLVIAAFSNAMEKIKEAITREAGAITGGIPGLSGLMGNLMGS